MTREEYMRLAMALASEAARDGEVPVGAIVTDGEGRVIGRGRNRREKTGQAAAHAEMEAIREACAHKGSWHLEDCTLYVTLEPCPMCAGCVLNARLGTVVYGAKEPYSGSVGSILNLFMEPYPWSPKVLGGVLGEECAALLSDFFRQRRAE